MKLLHRIISAIAATAALASCHHVEEYDGGMYGNFDALWSVVDEHYCFFAEKDVESAEVGARYRARINPDEMKATDFFNLCGDMLGELRDGHVNLSASFNVSYYRRWWSDYPQNLDRGLAPAIPTAPSTCRSSPSPKRIARPSSSTCATTAAA